MYCLNIQNISPFPPRHSQMQISSDKRSMDVRVNCSKLFQAVTILFQTVLSFFIVPPNPFLKRNVHSDNLSSPQNKAHKRPLHEIDFFWAENKNQVCVNNSRFTKPWIYNNNILTSRLFKTKRKKKKKRNKFKLIITIKCCGDWYFTTY